MSELINPEYLPETLAALRAWRESEHWLPYEFAADRALAETADRLFAAPEPAPRSEAVLAAAEAWYHRPATKGDAPTPEDCTLEAACRAAFGEQEPPTCAVPHCGLWGTEPTEGRDGSTLHLCPEHAAWFVAVTP